MAWQDGAYLVLRRDAAMAPARCIFTNAPVFETSMVRRQLTWGRHTAGNAPLPTSAKFLLAAVNMKRVAVTFGVSDAVKIRRLTLLGCAAAAMFGGSWLFWRGLQQGFPPHLGLMAGGAALAVIALTLFASTHSTLDIIAMDEEFVWLRGAQKPFLDSLPEFPRA